MLDLKEALYQKSALNLISVITDITMTLIFNLKFFEKYSSTQNRSLKMDLW